MILGESKEETISRLVSDWNDGHIDADVLLMVAYEAGLAYQQLWINSRTRRSL